MKTESSFSQADLYIYWQGFASKALAEAIQVELSQNESTRGLLEQVKQNRERWKFLELPKEPISESLLSEICKSLPERWKYVSTSKPEFGQLWSVKGLDRRYAVIVYADHDDENADETNEVLRAVLLSDQIQYASPFDLIIEPAYLPVQFRTELNVDEPMMLEAWNDFPLLRSQLETCYGSFSNKTQHFLNEMLLAYLYETTGCGTKRDLSFGDSGEIIGHSRGNAVPDTDACIAAFQLREIQVPQSLYALVSETLGIFDEIEEEKPEENPITSSVSNVLEESIRAVADFTQLLLSRMEYQQAFMTATTQPHITVIVQGDKRDLIQEGIVDVPTPPAIRTNAQGRAYVFDVLDLPSEYEGADFVVLYCYDEANQEWEPVCKGKVDTLGGIYVRIPVESDSIQESPLDQFEVRVFPS